MARRKVDLGLATLCIGGGQGMAMIVEKVRSNKISILGCRFWI